MKSNGCIGSDFMSFLDRIIAEGRQSSSQGRACPPNAILTGLPIRQGSDTLATFVAGNNRPEPQHTKQNFNTTLPTDREKSTRGHLPRHQAASPAGQAAAAIHRNGTALPAAALT
jgi:hypothetical protein